MSNPYAAVLEKIKAHKGTGGAWGLAQLLASMYNPMHRASLVDVFGPLDAELRGLALSAIRQFADHGENQSLRDAVQEIFDLYPALLERADKIAELETDTRDIEPGF